MNKISDIPKNQRPREKAVRYGFDTLSDAETLAIIISSGTREASAIDLANEILSNFGGLYNTITKPYEEFLKFKGIKQATATKLSAVFEIAKRYNSLRITNIENDENVDAENLFRKYVNSLAKFDHEVFIIIVLNKRKKIVFERTLFEGSEMEVSFSTRDVVKTVLSHNGYYFYVIHNHPSGDVLPSKQDIYLTSSLMKVCSSVGICLLDHLIIGKNRYYSFLTGSIKEESSENND